MGHFKCSRVIALLVLCSTALAQDPGVTLSFQSSLGILSNLNIATCTVLNFNSITSFTWQHNNTDVQEGGRIAVIRDLVNGRSRLEIDGLVQSDAGNYTCAVTLSNPSSSLVAAAMLRVATPLLVSADPEQEAVAGTTAELRCTVQSSPDPRLMWIRVASNDTRNTLLQQNDPQDPDFGIFRIANVDTEDAGEYVCRGAYVLGSEEQSINLIVLVAPVITSDGFMGNLAENGDDFTATCQASGMRPPTYSWLFNGVDISEGNDQITVNRVTGELTVSNLIFNNTGSYTCVASNSVGEDQQVNSLVVFGPPDILTPAVISFVTAPSGLRFDLRCPFQAFPEPTVAWRRTLNAGATQQLVQASTGSGFEFDSELGALTFRNPQSADGGIYTCSVENEHGIDTRTFEVLIIGLPNSPRNLQVSPVTGNATSAVELEWDPPSVITNSVPVDEYVLEVQYEGIDSQQITLSQRVPSNETSARLSNLLPGTTHEITVRSSNLAGLSPASNTVSHTTAASAPVLAFFRATPQDNGRSILLEWELLSEGGRSITEFTVLIGAGDEVLELALNISDTSSLVTGLLPNTEYTIDVSLGNSFAALSLQVTATTPLAPPSKPTTPQIVVRTAQSFTLSFSVLFGSSNITLFLVNITDEDGVQMQKNISVDNLAYIEQLVPITNEVGDEGYEVRLVILGLENRRSYMFQVAAVNSVGTGEFSEPSSFFTLEDDRIIFYIIAGVVGGVLLVVIVIILVIIVGVCRKRILKERRKLAISSYGQPPETAKTTDSFVLQEPPSGHYYNRNTPPSLDKNAPPANGHLSSNNNEILSNSEVPNNEDFDAHIERMSSPFYNTLSGYQPPQGDVKFVDLDVVVDGIDSPAELSAAKESHLQDSALPTGQIGSTHHSKLQTSLNNLTLGSTGSQQGHAVSAAVHYPDSVVSEKSYLTTSPYLQDAVSKSTPAISRDSTDMDTVPPSYMTDV